MRHAKDRRLKARQALCRAVIPLALLLGGGTVLAQEKSQEQTSPVAVFEKYGLLGTWAVDCDSRATPDNNYQVYRALDDGRVQYDAMDSPTRRTEVGVVESAVEVGPQDIQYTGVIQFKGREYSWLTTIRVDGNHRR